jgi:hypothetical protein
MAALRSQSGQAMTQAKAEQRTTRRFTLKLPLTVKLQNGEAQQVPAETKDVSARGVFFYFDSDLSAGSPLEFTLTLPPEITLTENIRVRCTGRVVRVDHSEGSTQVGVAAAIEQYEFLND